jgi:hypothetical protein
MMKRLLAKLPWVASLSATVLLCACATSERQAAKQLDPTCEIVQQASNLFAGDKELSRFPIVVDGFKGAMRLKGHVETQAQKTRAEKIVWALKGVKSVQNELQLGLVARP